MSNISELAPDGKKHSFMAFLAYDWPYLLMLVLSVVGVALSSVTSGRVLLYWEVVVPIFALSCFFARGPFQNNRDRITAIRQDALHWLAVFLSMHLLILPMLNVDAIALMLLTVLGLGLFTAGNQIGSWRIALVGILLSAAVPGMAWIQRSAMLMALGVIGVICFFIFVVIKKSPEQTK
jgi:hypothetical protein